MRRGLQVEFSKIYSKIYSKEDTLQTQRRVWNVFQQYNVVSLVVSVALAIVFGVVFMGVTARTNGQGVHVPPPIVCAKTDHTYKVVQGDQLASIAAYYGFNVQQIATYNAITHPDTLYPNQTICIPGTATNDSVDLVRTYQMPARPTSQVSPIVVQQQTVQLASGKKEQPEAPKVEATAVQKLLNPSVAYKTGHYSLGASGTNADGFTNVFPFGQCTWWAAQRYFQLHDVGVPWTYNANANQWVARAHDFGWQVSSKPTVGSIIVMQADVQGAGDVGHVGIVEQILSDGAVIVSSMNWGNHSGMVTNDVFNPGPGISFVSQ
jgi:surface antigen